MSKYDTHGGYFAPKDSMRINEGGSHEENPNGGVQIGVDEQGIPNMLEEGEPVYKDFVYSDNIKASEKFLEANSIPTKYKDKLYSEIADSFFEEADERPYDPVSRNGLEAMLGRLASAQEQQKEDKERRSLERELKNLSPEELEALEQELVAGLSSEEPVAEPMPQQPVEEQPVEMPAQEDVQPTMMEDGGKINKFENGNPLNFYDEPQAPYTWNKLYRNSRKLPITAGFGLGDAFNPYGLKNGTPINPDHWLHYRTNGTGIVNDFDFNNIDVSGYFPDDPQSTVSDGRYGGGYGNGYSYASSGRVNTAYVAPPDITEGIKSAEAQRVIDTRDISLPKGPGFNNNAVRKNEPDKPVGMPVVDSDYTGQKYSSAALPTFSRYAGAIGSGILGLYNAFQKPDKYTATRIKPYVPTGHINLQSEQYMPVDQNVIQNQMLAQGNSTQRALRNSGLGPSTAAAILAADNNTTGNLGQGFLQTWQANNQQRNAVLAANNQAEAQRAQFDYAVDAAKQRALQEAEWRNVQNDLMLQRWNYQAEADKYNALSNQINAGLEALSGIGRENFIRNQINSNTALNGYKTLGNGIGAYIPGYGYIRKCGGKIKK